MHDLHAALQLIAQVMVRERCDDSTATASFSDISGDSYSRGRTFVFDNFAARLEIWRICWCAASHDDYDCTSAVDYLTDAGEVTFYEVPGAPEPRLIQYDDHSLTFWWPYPADGGSDLEAYAAVLAVDPDDGDGSSTRGWMASAAFVVVLKSWF